MCKFRWKWDKHPEEYTELEKKNLIARVMEVAIRTTFKSHFYKWNGHIYKQQAGGPIGLRASGSIAKVCMEVWLQEFRLKLEKAGLEVHLLKKYVDDVIIVCSMAKRGDRVSKEGQIGREMESLGEDIRNGVSKQQNTLRILEEVGNRILPF